MSGTVAHVGLHLLEEGLQLSLSHIESGETLRDAGVLVLGQQDAILDDAGRHGADEWFEPFDKLRHQLCIEADDKAVDECIAAPSLEEQKVIAHEERLLILVLEAIVNGFGQPYQCHLLVGIDQVGPSEQSIVLAAECSLEGNATQEGEILLGQLPFAAHQSTLRHQLQQTDGRSGHHHLLHRRMHGRLDEAAVVVAFWHIEAARIIVSSVHAMNAQRVVVEPDVEETLGHLTCLHQGDGIGTGHGAVAHLRIGPGQLLYASPVLPVLHVEQLTDDSHIRPLPLVEADDGCQAENDDGQLHAVLPRRLVLGDANESGHWLAAEAAYHNGPDAENHQDNEGDAEYQTCPCLEEDVESQESDDCHVAQCREVLDGTPRRAEPHAVARKPAAQRKHQRHEQAAEPRIAIELQHGTPQIAKAAIRLAQNELHDAGVLHPKAVLAADVEDRAVVPGRPKPGEDKEDGQDRQQPLPLGGGRGCLLSGFRLARLC